MTQHNNIFEAINAVMQEVGYVKKQKAQELSYTFAGEAALIAALRPVMVEHGIFVYPAGVTDARLERETSGKGTPYTHFHATYTFVFQHVHSDTFVSVQVEGEGIDYGDKAVSKASTIAYKYALRQTFCIETGDDPDRYASDNSEGGLRGENRKRGPSTNVAPKNTPQTPPAPASAAEPVVKEQTDALPTAPSDVTLPPPDAPMASLSGKALYDIQANAWVALNMNHPKHFENRWKKRYNVKNLKDIPGTFGDFMTIMAMEDEAEAA